MAMTRVLHDSTLSGDGTLQSLLKLSGGGLKNIDASIDRKVHYTTEVIAPLGQNYILYISSTDGMSVGDWYVDSVGNMARIYSIDIDYAVHLTTFYIPPSSSSLLWKNITGDMKENFNLETIFGDTGSVYLDNAPIRNLVNLINAVRLKIGEAPLLGV